MRGSPAFASTLRNCRLSLHEGGRINEGPACAGPPGCVRSWGGVGLMQRRDCTIESLLGAVAEASALLAIPIVARRGFGHGP